MSDAMRETQYTPTEPHKHVCSKNTAIEKGYANKVRSTSKNERKIGFLVGLGP